MAVQLKPSIAAEQAAKFDVALDHFREFAAEVGIFISCFAIVEGYVHRMLARLTSMSDADAFVVAGSFASFSHRVDLLESILKRQSKTSEQAVAIAHLVAGIKQVTALRNAFAHGTYSLGFKGGRHKKGDELMWIKSYSYDARRAKPKSMDLDLAGIQAHVRTIKFLICELHGFIHRDEMPTIPK